MGGFGASFVVMLLFADVLAGLGADAFAAAAADAADAADASDAAAASACLLSFAAPLLPTISADDFADAASCCFITSPIGTAWPSVSTTTFMSALVTSSRTSIVPFASEMSPSFSFQVDGSVDCLN